MLINRALKTRIYPNSKQRNMIDTTINCCRYVYNHMLARNIKVYDRRKEHLSYYDMQNLLPDMKEYLPWLKEADSQALKFACRTVNEAFTRFFKKQNKFPRFHSKHSSKQSYTTTQANSIRYENNKVYIPCVGWVKHKDKCSISGKICRLTVSKTSNGKYYASVLYKYEVDIPDVKLTKAIGLDYSSHGFYVDSDGSIANMPRWFGQSQQKLKKAQRRLKRKSVLKKNEHKSRAFLKNLFTVRKIHFKISNRRSDWLHKESKRLSEEYDIICVESINMKTLSNKGFGNGKATMDNGYGMFLTMLNYKLSIQGKCLVKIDKFFPSSQTCHVCGGICPKTKDLSVRKWVCPDCGSYLDRDVNAAINIKNEGLRLLNVS